MPSGGDGFECMLSKDEPYTQGSGDAQYTCYPLQASSLPTTTTTIIVAGLSFVGICRAANRDVTFDSWVADKRRKVARGQPSQATFTTWLMNPSQLGGG